MSDEFDVAVHDTDALEEIELLANLIIASSAHAEHLSDSQIDSILGVGTPTSPVSATDC